MFKLKKNQSSLIFEFRVLCWYRLLEFNERRDLLEFVISRSYFSSCVIISREVTLVP